MTSLIGRMVLIFLDPLDPEMKRLAAPLYSEAARRRTGDRHRDRRAEPRAGEQPAITRRCWRSANSFPLFLHDERRRAARARARARTVSTRRRTCESRVYADELADWPQDEPERFSPNVTLRAVVQDYLLPTIAYFGGAAEIAYFAQTAEVYRVLDRPVTPILPRSSLTMIERHTGRVLERYGLTSRGFL